MVIALHKKAATRLTIRRKISLGKEPVAVLAARCAVSEDNLRRWRGSDRFKDGYNSVSTANHSDVGAGDLRRGITSYALGALDDLLAITREFINPNVSRPGLDRCLRRHGASNLNALKPKELAAARKGFKTYQPGFLHINVKYLPKMPDETRRRYLFVAIDWATRWVFVRIMSSKTAANARQFVRELARTCPIRITKILTDNDKEFTGRLFASRHRDPTSQH